MSETELAEDKRTPAEWLETPEYTFWQIMDPDGWRDRHAPAWSTPLTHAEFQRRFAQCTVGPRVRMENTDE